jgi:hypothetical protein
MNHYFTVRYTLCCLVFHILLGILIKHPYTRQSESHSSSGRIPKSIISRALILHLFIRRLPSGQIHVHVRVLNLMIYDCRYLICKVGPSKIQQVTSTYRKYNRNHHASSCSRYSQYDDSHKHCHNLHHAINTPQHMTNPAISL